MIEKLIGYAWVIGLAVVLFIYSIHLFKDIKVFIINFIRKNISKKKIQNHKVEDCN